MNNEFDRYEIERIIKSYSNDLLFAKTESDTANAVSRAQSLISDFEYLKKVALKLDDQIKECQKKL